MLFFLVCYLVIGGVIALFFYFKARRYFIGVLQRRREADKKAQRYSSIYSDHRYSVEQYPLVPLAVFVAFTWPVAAPLAVVFFFLFQRNEDTFQ